MQDTFKATCEITLDILRNLNQYITLNIHDFLSVELLTSLTPTEVQSLLICARTLAQ